MVEDVVIIIGAIAGYVSLGILIYKIMKERPQLKFDIEKSIWYIVDKNSIVTTFQIELRIDNKGDRGTTIHRTTLNFDYKNQEYNLVNNHASVTAHPSGTVKQIFEFYLPFKKTRIEGDVKGGRLVVHHTHGEKSINLSDIKRPNWDKS